MYFQILMLIFVNTCSVPVVVTTVSPPSTIFALRYINNNSEIDINFNITFFSDFQKCLSDTEVNSCLLQSSAVNFFANRGSNIKTEIISIETDRLTKPANTSGSKLCTISLYKHSFLENYFSINCSVSEYPCMKTIAIDFIRDDLGSRCGFSCWLSSLNVMFIYSPDLRFVICDSEPRFTLTLESATQSAFRDISFSTTSAALVDSTTANVLYTTRWTEFSGVASSATSTSTSTDKLATRPRSTVSVPETTTIPTILPIPSEIGKEATTTTVLSEYLPTIQKNPNATTTTHSTVPATIMPTSTTATRSTTVTLQPTSRPVTMKPQTTPILIPSTTKIFYQPTAGLPSTVTTPLPVTSNLNKEDTTKHQDTLSTSQKTEVSQTSTAAVTRETSSTKLIDFTSSITKTSESFPDSSITGDYTESTYTYPSPSLTHLNQQTSQPNTAAHFSTNTNQVPNTSTMLTVATAQSDENNNKTIVIILSVIVSLLVVATAVIFVYLYLQRRRRKRTFRANDSTRVLRAYDSMDLENMRVQQTEDSHYSDITEVELPEDGRRGQVTPDLISSCEGSSSSDAHKQPTVPDLSTIPRGSDEYSRLHLPRIVSKPEPVAAKTTPVEPAVYDNVRLQDLEPIYNLSSFSDDLNDGGNQTSTPKRDADTGRMLKFHDVNPYSVVVLDPTLLNQSSSEAGFLQQSHSGERTSNTFYILNSVSEDLHRAGVSKSDVNESPNTYSKTYGVTNDYYILSEVDSDCLSVSATSSFNMYSGKNATEDPEDDNTLPVRVITPGTQLKFVFPAETL